MAKRPLPSVEVLRQLLRYEPETGKLFWRERGPEWFKCERDRKIWNTKNAGNEALNYLHKGYFVGTLLGVRVQAHRAAFAMHIGDWPSGCIDHVNGDTGDNRICNLRDVSIAENGRNQKRRSTNKSGTNGVSWDRASGKWRAQILANGKKINLGRFENKADAVAARAKADVKYGYHPNHGR